MQQPSNVKNIMARFGQGGNSAGGIHGGHPNLAPRPTPSPGSTLLTRKGALENMLSGATASSTPSPKPNFQRNNVSVSNSSPDESSGQEFPKPRALASRFETNSFPKPQPFKPKPLEPSQDNKPKPLFPKTPLKKPSAGNIVLDATPASPKPPPPFAKPPFVKDDSKSMDDAGGGIPTPPKMPTFPKKSSSIQSQLNKGGVGESAGVKPNPVLAQKPSGFRAAQNAFNKDSGDREGEHETEEDSKTVNTPKPPTPHIPAAPKPLTAQKPGFAKRPLGSTSETDESSDPSAPKKKPLPKSFVLGSPPPKPDRPPNVNLEKFKKGLESVNDDSGKHGGLPPPPTSHPSNLEPPPPPPPPHPSLPSLPPRDTIQPDVEESYDDVGVLNPPPPLPGGGQNAQKTEDSASDGEMYEDLEERWNSKESKEKAKKREKEEKKRLEQEKKEQKEREKKEQEIRKRFKLSGPIQVIHNAKVRTDCKGGKNDLSVKQGDLIEIVRVTDNPGGRWLGRTRDGSYGYVKIESVEIDYDDLKRKNQGELLPSEGQLYDDVGTLDNSGLTGQAAMIPPMPDEDGEIYDDLDDPNLSLGLPPPPPEVNNADEVYDDVESQPFPPPPPTRSLPQVKSKGKAEEKDPKKQKKFEKEEKEFRKKFKYDGEIQVLYQVTVASTLTTKKWGNKDLPLKPGETIDVIVKPTDNKLIGRNQDGKFGYVLLSNIVAEDEEIYDDINEECIYDND